jgi:hypothetical protein
MTSPIELKQCIDHCFECHRSILETVQYCLTLGGRHAQAAHIQLLQNCASICQTSAEFMIAVSPLHPDVCAAAAQVCTDCADECESFEDYQMERCAQACRRCAESCGRMSRRKVAA